MMKKETPAAAGNVESINDQLFAGFSAEDEKLWLVGGTDTKNLTATYNPGSGTDADAQWDWTF
jgi:hypothetical protein